MLPDNSEREPPSMQSLLINNQSKLKSLATTLASRTSGVVNGFLRGFLIFQAAQSKGISRFIIITLNQETFNST